jgi:hypothetical protein
MQVALLRRPNYLTLSGQPDEYGVENRAANSSEYPVNSLQVTSINGAF